MGKLLDMKVKGIQKGGPQLAPPTSFPEPPALSPHATLDGSPPRHALPKQLLQCDVRLTLKTSAAIPATIPADAAVARRHRIDK